jgi:23S rRNA (uridine2552-2'-O)-methyltransferase
MPDRKDRFYYLAKKDNFRSRATFKLMEMDRKFGLLSHDDFVLEFGSSPGGWTQYIRSVTAKPIVSVDLSPMEPIENVYFIRGDIMNPGFDLILKNNLEKIGITMFNVILSDAMVHTSGNRGRDHASSFLLDDRIMTVSLKYLAQGGNIALKQFYGDLTRDFMKKWAGHFRYSGMTTPEASRRGSSEIYIVFRNRIYES